MSELIDFSRRKFIYTASCACTSGLLFSSCTEVAMSERKQLIIYPNPSSGIFYINNNSLEPLQGILSITNISGSLGGISGGAVVDRTGALIGMNSAASVRRGRIFTSRPSKLMHAIRLSGNFPPAASQNRPMISELTGGKYPSFAKAAIQARRVVRVICRRRQ